MNVLVGTSGYSFKDWRGEFYPSDIESGGMLDYYQQEFDTVEINSTYYTIPHQKVFYNMVKKTPADFEFIIKLPQTFTHKREGIETDCQRFLEAVKPVAEADKLKGLLAQFPYSFKFNEDALDYLAICNESVKPFQLFAEFRHNSWVNRRMYDRLKGEKIGYVAVDEPQLKGLLAPDCFATTDTAYIRLHGRNAEQWWGGRELRYDYYYSKDELIEWREKIKKTLKHASKAFVFFNNCHHGQAAKNAILFKKLLADENSIK